MITSISIDNTQKWDGIVKSFPNYDVTYLSDYAKAFQTNGEGTPKLIYFENGHTRAMNVIMERDIALSEPFRNKLEPDKWLDISTPYGYGGFWIEGMDSKIVEKEYEAYCRDMNYISEFVRFHLLSEYEKVFTGEIENPITNVVRTLDPPIDEIFMDFESKVRRNIKKAIRNGLTVKIDEDGAFAEEFLNLYYKTMERRHAKSSYFFPREYFSNINHMRGNYVYASVMLDGKVIASDMVLYGSENCYSFLCCSDSEYFEMRPNDLLKFEIIKWAKEKDLKRYVLGGGYGGDDSLFQFKRSFAPHGLYKFHVGKRVLNEKKYQDLVTIRKEIMGYDPGTNFFPQYRTN